MSTKIYNGYKIKASSMEEAIGVINQGKNAMADFLYEKSMERYVGLAAENVYEFFLTHCDLFATTPYEKLNELSFMSPLMAAHDIIQEQDKKYNYNKVAISAHFFPTPQTILGEKHYLLTVNASQASILKKFKSIYRNSISEHNFWDNTDKPSKISNKNWGDRRMHWECAAPTGFFALDGMLINFVLDLDIYTIPMEKKAQYLKKWCKTHFSPENMMVDKNRYTTCMSAHLLLPEGAGYKESVAMQKKIENNDLSEPERKVVERTKEIIECLFPAHIDERTLTQNFQVFLNDMEIKKEKLSLNQTLSSAPEGLKKMVRKI